MSRPRRTRLAMITALACGLGACQGLIGGGSSEDAPSDDVPSYDSDVDGGGQGHALTFYYGPMKLMLGESILYSVAAITHHDFGGWDFTAPDPATQAFVDSGNADDVFYRHCRLLGGCLEHRIPQARTSFVGTAYVLELEKAVTEACYDREAFGMFPSGQAPSAATQVIDLVRHQFRAAFAADASPAELERSIAYFDGHLAAPELDDISPLESAGRGHCRALLTTNRFLFY
jgi:hypothetical protein